MKKECLLTALIVIVFSFFPVISDAKSKHGCGCSQTKDRVSQLFHWMDKIGDPRNPMRKEDMEKYFSQNTEQYTNGKLVAKGADAIYKRFTAIRNQYQSAHIQFHMQNMLIDGDKAAIRYVMTFTDKDGEHKINDMAIIKFDQQGKVTEFWESFDAGDPVKL